MQKIDRTQLANIQAAGGCCKCCCAPAPTPRVVAAAAPVTPASTPR